MIEAGLFDAIIRGVAIGGFATSGVALATSRQSARFRWVGSVFFATAIGHALSNCLLLVKGTGPLDGVLWLLSAMGTGMFWTFAVTLFNDEREVPLVRWVPPLISLVLALVGNGAEVLRPAWIVYNLFSVVLVIHALSVIWQGWKGDLVEPRRQLRAPVMAAAAAYVLITATNDMGDVVGWPVGHSPILQAVALALLGIGGALALLRLDPVLVGPASAPVDTSTQSLPADLDKALLARLTVAMDEDGLWRREDISIRGMADHLGVAEHRLRKLINGSLGHRNFAAFINARRIGAAKLALADPELSRTSISAIAFDLGFGSLGPFNRAFREATGTTPTAWRQGESSPKPEIS